MSNQDAKPEPEKAPPRRRSRRIKRRIAVYSTFVALCVVALLWFVPIRGAWLDNLVASGLQEATGSNVEFESAKLYLGQGLFEINNLTFIPPRSDGGSTPWLERVRCGRAQVRFTLSGVLWNSPKRVKSLRVYEPSEVVFTMGEHGVRPPDIWNDFLLAWRAQRHQASAESTGIVIAQIDVSRFAARLDVTVASGEVVSAGVKNAKLRVSNGEGELTRAVLEGARINGRANRWRADVTRLPASGRLLWLVDLDGVVLKAPVPAVSDYSIRLQRPRIEGEYIPSLSGKGGSSGAIDVRARHLDISTTEGVLVASDEDVQVEAEWWCPEDVSRIVLRRLVCRGDSTDLRIEGQVSTKETLDWDASLDVFGLPGALAEWALERTGQSDLVDLSNLSRPWGHAEASGGLRPVTATLERADLRLAGLSVAPSNGYSQIREGEIDLTYTPEQLTVSHLSGETDGGIFRLLSGHVDGDALRDTELNGDFIWQADIDLARALKSNNLLAGAEEVGFDVGGRVSVDFGRLRIGARRDGDGQWALGRPAVEAIVRINDGWLSHERLPSRVTEINGELLPRDNALVISQLSGRVGDATIEDVSGTIKGRDQFWTDPRLSLKFRSRIRAAEVAPLLPEPVQDLYSQANISGAADVALTIDGPAMRPSELRVGGTAQLSNVRFKVDYRDIVADVHDGSCALEINDDTLYIDRFKAGVGDLAFACRGQVTTAALALSMSAEGDLADAQQVAARYLRVFDVAGTATAQAELRMDFPLSGLGGSESTSSLGSWPSLWYREVTATNGQTKRPVFWASVRADGAQWTPERFPAPVRNIRGEVTFADGVFHIDKALADFGESKNVTVSGKIALPAYRTVNLWFDLDSKDTDLSEWLVPWRHNPRGSQLALPEKWRRPTPQENATRTYRPMTIDIRGDLRSRRSSLSRYRLGDLAADISYTLSPDKRPELVIAASNRAYEGKTSSTLQMNFPARGKSAWQVAGFAEEVNVKPLLADNRRRPTADVQEDGLLSGMIELRAESPTSQTLRGRGHGIVDQTLLKHYRVFQTLQRASRFNLFGANEDPWRIETDFAIHDRRVWLSDFTAMCEAIEFDMFGSVGFDKSLDLLVKMDLFRFASIIPGFGTVVDVTGLNFLFDKSGLGQFIADRKKQIARVPIQGTTDAPKVTVLSMFGSHGKASLIEWQRPLLQPFAEPTTKPLSLRSLSAQRPK